MNRTDDRLLPVLLICAQAAVWPGAALARGTVPDGSALLVAVLVAGPVTAALALRRTYPVVALMVVTVACALGAGPLPTGGTAVLGTAGVALALFTVATERDTFTAVLCVVTLAAWQLAQGITLNGLSDRDGLDLVLTAVLYAAACGTGLFVRRRRHARQAAEHLLKRAEAERHRLPAVERRRMERELHDVSAHHLTAVVVTVGAASGLRERRPELADEALEFAVETGREVTRALGSVRAPAPSREELPSPEERLKALVAGFRRLDQPVDFEIDPLPDGALADAAYGIVREALTNVARHAPGARTTVLCRYGDTRTDVVVTSAPPPTGVVAHGAGLGGGRGTGFLRSRAREAGGTLTTGPTPEGGWEVRATLPGRTAAPVEDALPRNYRAAQVVAAIGLFAQPLLGILVIRDGSASTNSHVSAGVLFALLAAAQAVALLWLGRAPRVARGVLLGMALLWPMAMAVGDYTGPVLLPPMLAMIPTCVAVEAPKGRGAVSISGSAAGRDQPPPARTYALPQVPISVFLIAATVVHTTALTTAVLHRGTTLPTWLVATAATTVVALIVGAAHYVGAVRRNRDRTAQATQTKNLATWTEAAVKDAWAERQRIATGLETTVLARTADMIAEAHAGRLDATATRAREALAAMRALLDTVRDGETGGTDLRPQPTLQALDLLAQQCRATGRDVEIRLTDRVPDRLPTEVDLAAYHAAETLLATGDDEPAVLELDAADGTLTITATGVPGAAGTAVRERLTARIAPLGGTLTAGPPGTLGLRLPLAQADEEGER
ncbi:histidine kinase [Streptomyces sp. NPDC001002]